MEDASKYTTRWERRDAKKRAKKRFSSDNRRSVRWLHWKSRQQGNDDRLNANTSSDML